MKRYVTTHLLLGLVLTYSSLGMGETFRVAGLFARSSEKHPSYTYSVDAACITEAVIKRAKARGLDISFTLVDQGWDFNGTIAAANRIAREKYDGVIGGLVSLDALVAADVFERGGIPFITPTASHPKITANRNFVTRISFNDYRQASLLAKLTSTEIRPKRVAIIRNVSQPYSDFLGTQFALDLKSIGFQGSVTEFPIIDGYDDFGKLAQEIIKGQADLVLVSLTQPNTASVYAELAKRSARLTLLSTDTIEGKPEFLKSLGRKSAHIRFIYPKHWNDRFEGPEAASYMTLHREFCSRFVPSMTTAAAYDAAELLIRALTKSPQLRGKALIQAMRDVRYTGMTGTLVYGPDGDPVKPLELFELRGELAVHWKRYE